VTRDPGDLVTPVTPPARDPRDPSDPQGHDPVTPHDPPSDPVTCDPVTPVTRDPRSRDRVVTPLTPRATTDIDQWVTQALAAGATRSQVIHAAMTGSPIGTGTIPRTVSESTAKRALRRCCTRQENTA
jgi:hypothetical protein